MDGDQALVFQCLASRPSPGQGCVPSGDAAAVLSDRPRFRGLCKSYKGSRGMDFLHDVHDWIGGYPYEEISESQVDALMQKLNFQPVARWVEGLQTGLLGSGCDEYVFRRPE